MQKFRNDFECFFLNGQGCIPMNLDYKNEAAQDWKSSRFEFQEPNISFLDLPKNSPDRIIELELNDIFMQVFSPRGIVFEEGMLTISQHLEDLFFLLLDNSKFEKSAIHFIRDSDILYFINVYLEFVIQHHQADPDYGAELLMPCKILALFLEKHIFLPIELECTPLIKILVNLAKSEISVEQAAGVCALSFMVQPSCKFPEYIARKFMPLVTSFLTSFNNNTARLGCLHFIHEFYRFIKDIPPDIIVEITEQINDVFNEKNKSRQKEYSKLYSSCIECLRMQLLYYPESFQLIIDLEILSTVNHFLASNKDKLLISASRFFSVIFTEKKYDLDFFCQCMNYSSVIDNAGYEVNPDVQKSSLWLLIDIASRGPMFIDQLFYFDILKFFSDIYSTQDVKIKLLIIGLLANFLINSSSIQESYVFDSSILYTACNEIQVFQQPEIYRFLKALNIGIHKLSSLDNYDQIKRRLQESNLVQSLNDLESCELEKLGILSRRIVSVISDE